MKKYLLGLFVLGFMFAGTQNTLAATSLFSDNFDQSGSGLGTNNWSSISGGDSGDRRPTSDDSFTVGVSSNGLLMEGKGSSHSNDPDESAEHTFATQGFSTIHVSYSRAISSFESGDSFVAQYSLDDGAYVNMEILTANQPHSTVTFDIDNSNRYTKLQIRFYVNGDEDNDEVGVDNLSITGEGDPLFYDGFESNDFGAGSYDSWSTEEAPLVTQSSSNSWTNNNTTADGHSANIDGINTTDPDDAIYRTVDTTGYEDVKLRFARKIDNLGTGESFKVYLSTVAGSPVWSEIYSAENVAFATELVSLGLTAENNPNTKIRFEINGSGGSDDAYIDDVVVWGDLIPVVTTGSLNITKTTIGGDGTFSFSGTGGIGAFDLTSVANTISQTFSNLLPGNFTITETVPSGWDQTSSNCTDVAVTVGNTSTCTIVNTKRGSITVTKNVLNPDGEEVSDTTSFSVTLDGGSTQSVAEGTPYTYTNLVPGTYTIAEIVPEDPDFDLLSIDQDSDGDTAGSQVVVSAGANVNVTVTNKQKKAKIIVNKIVTNPNGGEAVAGDFSFQVNDGESMSFTQDEENPLMGSYELMLNPGSYSVTEVTPEGSYAISYNNCTDLVLTSNGATQTCTITNSDIPETQGAITVIKALPNDNGGDFTLGDFPLKVTTGGEEPTITNMTSGVSQFFNPGTYNVYEENPNELSGFASSISCTDGESTTENGNITLVAQQSWTCTITNNDNAPSLTLVKVVTNDDGGNASAGDWTLTATGPTTISGAGGVSSGATFQAGTYTLSEMATNEESEITEDYTAGTWSCTNQVAVSETNQITLGLGQSTTCTITNDDNEPVVDEEEEEEPSNTGTLIVRKVIINDNAGTSTATNFSFKVNDGEPIQFNADGQKFVTLTAGTYSVLEVADDGYTASYDNCSEISIPVGGVQTCIITNDDIRPVRNGGGANTGGGGEVAGASTENTGTTEEPQGEVLGASTEGETAACVPFIKTFMKYGAKNNKDEVKLLQAFLNEELKLSPPLVVDGNFGKSTKKAVIAFQKKYKKEILDPWVPFGLSTKEGTGYVYKTTQWWINKLKCGGESADVPAPKLP